MFTLPDILYGQQRKPFLPFIYLHVNSESTRKSRLNFTKPCISIILQGEKRVFGDSKYDSFRQGDLILFKPGNYLGYEVIESDEMYSSLMMFFDFEKISKQQPSIGEGKVQVHKADAYLVHFARSCELLWQQGQLTADEPLQSLKFDEFLHYASSNGRDLFSFFYAGGLSKRAESFKDCIERYWNSTLSVEEIAFLCNMSLSAFKRAFQEAYLESPGKWLKRRRLEHAAKLIKVFNRNPTDVYLETGYADYSSFSYSFKKQFGIGPKEYRQG